MVVRHIWMCLCISVIDKMFAYYRNAFFVCPHGFFHQPVLIIVIPSIRLPRNLIFWQRILYFGIDYVATVPCSHYITPLFISSIRIVFSPSIYFRIELNIIKMAAALSGLTHP